jgi:predicted nuclease of restriction endonuclease-like (RecB) superfamily
MNITSQPNFSSSGDDKLYQDIKGLIERSKAEVVSQINQTLVLTYWRIGKIVKTEVLQTERAQYGEATLKQLALRLSQDYGAGFSYSSLTRMAKFYAYMPDLKIVATVSQQLSWSHFVELIKVDDTLKREFYMTMCMNERWSVRVLRDRMNSLLFERTAIAKEPDKVIRQELSQLARKEPNSPKLFIKDPYLLDFLGLSGNFSERDLENAILRELEQFILEMGNDFAFLGRQKRIQVGGHDYYLDLLFYHRKLKRLVLIELKLGEFSPEHKGQVELYLKWLSKYEKQEDEQEPIALILCSGKDRDLIELLDLERDNIHVSEYWLQLPSKDVLQAKLHLAIEQAHARIGVLGSKDD